MSAGAEDAFPRSPIPIISHSIPHCYNMQELPEATTARAQVIEILKLVEQNKPLSATQLEFQSTPLYTHLCYGLAYTTGSALGCKPPTPSLCLTAFQDTNKVGLTAGARAWAKHAHRSQSHSENEKPEGGWWGFARGPVKVMNEKARTLFCKVMKNASWRNLHMLPHSILAYEIRVPEGYGMRWSQDLSPSNKEKRRIVCLDQNESEDNQQTASTGMAERPWIFRGFLEPMIKNGHELGWRHPPMKPSIPTDTSASASEKSSVNSA